MNNRQRHSQDRLRDDNNDAEDIAPAHDDPSWFLHPANQQSPEELVSRYRLSRNLPEHLPSRDSVSRYTYATPEYRDLILSRPRPPARFIDTHHQDTDDGRPKQGRAPEGLSLTQTFALAAIMAVISGGTVGFLSTQFSTIRTQAQAMMLGATVPVHEVKTEPARQIQTVAASVISKKSIATARLQVADVTGQTNSLIPLVLSAQPAPGEQDLMLKISGLPDSAYLTTGKREADKVWALTMEDLKNVKLMVPTAEQREFDVAVGAFEKDSGKLAAPIKSMTIALSDVVIQPVAAPPPTQGGLALPLVQHDGQMAAIPMPSNVNVSLTATQHSAASDVSKGDSLLKSGDIEAARKAYEKAWSSGAPEGAYGIARSYDPVVLASLKAKGSEPDSKQAIEWYERAAVAGNKDADGAILRLRMKPR